MVGLWGQIVVNMPYIFTNFHEVSFDNANIHTISTNLNSMLFSNSRICNATDFRLFLLHYITQNAYYMHIIEFNQIFYQTKLQKISHIYSAD